MAARLVHDATLRPNFAAEKPAPVSRSRVSNSPNVVDLMGREILQLCHS